MNRIIKTTLFLFIFLLFSSTGLIGQQEPYFDEGYVRNDNAVYSKNIQTVLLYKAGFELSPPIIQFNTDEKLMLAFDDLGGDYKQYRYTVVHCKAEWETSDLRQMEYLDGFFEDYIKDYTYSFNTTTSFINYRLIFPTEDMKLRRSGNYILKVFLDSDEDQNIIFTRRFMVYEPMVTVEGKVANTVDLNLRYTHQEVDFKILTGGYSMTDTYRNLHVVVMQNGRWDNALLNIQPRNINGNVYDFTLIDNLVFPAGNEFRYFDMKTLKYNTDRMDALEYQNDGYHVYLMADVPRNKGNYYSEEDINGRRLIAANDTEDPYSEGDYAWVHFLLPCWPPLATGNLYISGALSDWRFNPTNLCRYNFELKAYEAKLFLKQGYYNYDYVFVENNTNTGDVSLIEGSYWETENEYEVLVYYQQQGDTYDRLIGVGFLNSRE